MLYIRIELWPGGNQHEAVVIGEARIANPGTGTRRLGDYLAEITTTNHAKKRINEKLVCSVSRFPRLKLTAWDLLYRCLHKMLGERNKP